MGFIYLFPPSYVALWDSKTPHRPACKRVSWCLETYLVRLLPRDGSPSLTLVSLFIFYILSCLLSKTMGCLSGCLVSSTSIQMLSCGIFSAFKWSFNEFVGGESGLPILFLCHLGPPPGIEVLSYLKIIDYLVLMSGEFTFILQKRKRNHAYFILLCLTS